MSITSDGNVGIGTTSPATKLDIQVDNAGAGIIVRTTPSDFLTIQSGGVYKGILGTGSVPLRITNPAGNVILQEANGNVGIGTTNPTSTLEVEGSFRANAITAGPSLGRYLVGNVNGLAMKSNVTYGWGSSSTDAGGAKDTGISRLAANTISVGNGNPGDVSGTLIANRIGIGTSAPDSKLHVLGTTEQLRLGYDASNFTSFTANSLGILTINSPGAGSVLNFGGTLAGGSRGISASTFHGMILSRNSGVHNEVLLDVFNNDSNITGPDFFRVRNSVSTFFNVTSAGNVGIGTSSPATDMKLDVAGRVQLNLAGTQTSTALCGSHASGGTETEADVEIVDCAGTVAADYMEMYPVEQSAKRGDIVSTSTNYVQTEDGERIGRLVKTSSAYQKNVIGIVSDKSQAGDFNSIGHNIKDADNPQPIALKGRVPVSISADSEPIEPGDYVTTSAEAGKGMKASRPGIMVGTALEGWKPGSGATTVLVYVTGSFADPQDTLARLQINLDEDGNVSPTIEQLTASPLPETTEMTEPKSSQLEELAAQLATTSAQLELLSSKTASMEAEMARIQDRISTDLFSDASSSALLASSEAQLDTLMVLQSANINNLGVTGTITAGVLSIEGYDATGTAAINTLASPLKLQSLGLNGIELVAGNVSIDPSGNIVTKGTITTEKVILDTADKESASIGRSSIPAGETAVVVQTTAVTEKSHFFVTPRTVTTLDLIVTNVISGESFTVEIPEADTEEIRFDWMITDGTE